MLPALLLYAGFVLWPLVSGFALSFFKWNGIGPRTFVGLDNYQDTLSSPVSQQAFVHAGVLMLFYAVVPIIIGLFVVGVLARVRVRGLAVLQGILFAPQVVAPVVIGVSWVAILALDGAANDVLRLLGLDGLARAWLGDDVTALGAIGLIGSWATIGLVIVLLVSGLGQIPKSLFEAARVDGAGPFREFWAVTLPGIRNQLAVALTLTVIAALRTFDLVYVTTKGGPGTSTMVPSYLVYSLAFVTGRLGYASVIAVVLTLILLVLTFVIMRYVEGRRRR